MNILEQDRTDNQGISVLVCTWFFVLKFYTLHYGLGVAINNSTKFYTFFPGTCISVIFYSFLELFYLRPPSFAKTPIYVYIADLHGEVGQQIC